MSEIGQLKLDIATHTFELSEDDDDNLVVPLNKLAAQQQTGDRQVPLPEVRP